MSGFLGSILWQTNRSLPAQCGGQVWNGDVLRCTNTDGDGYGQVDEGSMNSHFLFITWAYKVKKSFPLVLHFLKEGGMKQWVVNKTKTPFIAWVITPKCAFISLFLLVCS